MAERDLQASIVRYLNRLPDTVARVNGPGPAHVVGDPDIYGCCRGHMFQIEVKQPGQDLRPEQQYRLDEWAAAGAEVLVANSVLGVELFMEEAFSLD